MYIQKSHIFVTGLHVICIHRTDTGKVISVDHSASAYLRPVTTGSSLVKFDINILPVQDIPGYLFYGVRFEVVAGVLLQIQILLDVTLCCWASSSWCLEGKSFGLPELKDLLQSVGLVASYYRWVRPSALPLFKKDRNCNTYQKNILIIKCVVHFLLQFCLMYGFTFQ